MSSPPNAVLRSKYAVVRLKSNDDILGLFQLLMRHGYAEVSFVNDLNETIFPALPQVDQWTQTNPSYSQHLEMPLQHQEMLLEPQPTTDSSLNPIVRPIATSGSSPLNNKADNVGLLTAAATLGQNMGVATLPTIPSAFLGLPTLPSLMAAQFSSARQYHNDQLTSPSNSPPFISAFNSHTSYYPTHSTALVPNQISLPLHSAASATQSMVAPIGANVSHHHQQHSSTHRQRDEASVPNLTTSRESYVFNASILSGTTTTQLRQRGQRSTSDDPSHYVICKLCKNKIMGSRISNLTNHVRRHSTMKQFQCCYCDYTHNEMAKVRLHMLHNHKDKDSQPIDNIRPEMQIAWDLLMKECFPNHCQPPTPQPTATRRSWKQNSSDSLDQITEFGGKNSFIDNSQSPVDSATSKDDSTSNHDCECQEIEYIKPRCDTASLDSSDDPKNSESPQRLVVGSVSPKDCSAGDETRAQNVQHNDTPVGVIRQTFKRRISSPETVLREKVDNAVNELSKKQKIDDIDHPMIAKHEHCHNSVLEDTRSIYSNTEDVGSTKGSPELGCKRESPVNKKSADFANSKSQQTASLPIVLDSNAKNDLETFRCLFCLKQCVGMLSMMEHCKTHAFTKAFQCTECNYDSCSFLRVHDHIIRSHNEGTAKLIKHFRLKIALKSIMRRCFFNPLPSLYADVRRRMNNECLFLNDVKSTKTKLNGCDDTYSSKMCRMCGQTVRARKLLQHVRLHTPDEIYVCSQCSFTSSNVLHCRKHVLSHKFVRNSGKQGKIIYRNNCVVVRSYFRLCFGCQKI